MAFSRLIPNPRNSGHRTDKVRVVWIASTQGITEIRVPAIVSQQLRCKPNEKKVGIAIEVGSGEHLGLIRLQRAGPGIEVSRTINTTPTSTFIIRMGGIKPTDPSQTMGATAVSYMIEGGVLTFLLPARYATAPDAINFIKGEHAAEPQEEAPHSPAALNVPADL